MVVIIVFIIIFNNDKISSIYFLNYQSLKSLALNDIVQSNTKQIYEHLRSQRVGSHVVQKLENEHLRHRNTLNNIQQAGVCMIENLFEIFRPPTHNLANDICKFYVPGIL